ncbi:hypothetical protein DIPPA_23083 [Diplonema papillatum]|nr:hypothetical protein DIPPA_23083 [Diplonema papillatum]|eukprot:gene14929-22798_t
MSHCPLTSHDRILVVGDGNCSFGLALARLSACSRPYGWETRIVVSDVKGICQESAICEELAARGVEVRQRFDATSAASYARLPFCPTAVVFNFPHTGRNQEVEANRRLLSEFFAALPKKFHRHTRVYVTVKTGSPYDGWCVTDRGSAAGWYCEGNLPFDANFWHSYGYRHATTANLSLTVDISSACTYEFRHCTSDVFGDEVHPIRSAVVCHSGTSYVYYFF